MSPNPRVSSWSDVGDVLSQGGTVHTEKVTKVEQFGPTNQEKKDAPQG